MVRPLFQTNQFLQISQFLFFHIESMVLALSQSDCLFQRLEVQPRPQPGFSGEISCATGKDQFDVGNVLICDMNYSVNGERYHKVYWDPDIGSYIGQQGALLYLLSSRGSQRTAGYQNFFRMGERSYQVWGCNGNGCRNVFSQGG